MWRSALPTAGRGLPDRIRLPDFSGTPPSRRRPERRASLAGAGGYGGLGGPGAPGALGAPGGWHAGPPGLWLDGAHSIPRCRWRPAASARAPGSASAGPRLLVQAPRASGRPGRHSCAAGPGDRISLRADPANPFGWLVNKPFGMVPALPAPVIVDAARGVESPRGRSSWLMLLIAPVLSLARDRGRRRMGPAPVAVPAARAGRRGGLAGAAADQQADGRRARAPGERGVPDAAAAGQARLGDAVAAEERARRQALPIRPAPG